MSGYAHALTCDNSFFALETAHIAVIVRELLSNGRRAIAQLKNDDRYQPCKTLLSDSGSCRLCRPLALRRSSLSPWVSLNVNVCSLPKNKIMSTDPSQFEEEELHTLLWCRGNPDKVMEHAHQVSRSLLLGWRTYMSYIRVTHVKREV